MRIFFNFPRACVCGGAETSMYITHRVARAGVVTIPHGGVVGVLMVGGVRGAGCKKVRGAGSAYPYPGAGGRAMGRAWMWPVAK